MNLKVFWEIVRFEKKIRRVGFVRTYSYSCYCLGYHITIQYIVQLICYSFHQMSFPHERKLISIFKSFIEKALIPQMRKNDNSLLQWNKFSNMLAADSLNYNQLQLFVDTLPNLNIHTFSTTQPHGPIHQNDMNFHKKKEQISNEESSFSLKKTASCQKLPFTKQQTSHQSSQQQLLLTRNHHNYKPIRSSIERLLKKLEENHSVIESKVEKQNNWHEEGIKMHVQDHDTNKRNSMNYLGNCRASGQTHPHQMVMDYHAKQIASTLNMPETQVTQGYSRGYYY